MQLEKLPLSEYAFKTEVIFQEVLDTPDNANMGYFVKFDPSHPQGLHDDQRYLSLPTTKDIIEEEWLREYEPTLKQQHNLLTSKEIITKN